MSLTISHQLKAAREQRGLSLADAAHETRIPAIRLAQMEEGNFAAFGNMAYARSFVQLYSRFLGVDASAFVSQLPKPQLGGAADYRYLTASLGPWVEDKKTVRHRVSTRALRSEQGRSPGLHAMLIFLGIAACTAILGVESLSSKSLRTINRAPMSEASSRPTARVVVEPTPISTAVKVTPAPASPAASPKQVMVAKRAAERSVEKSLPAPVLEEIRTPDISAMLVKRAEPVVDDTLPSVQPDL